MRSAVKPTDSAPKRPKAVSDSSRKGHAAAQARPTKPSDVNGEAAAQLQNRAAAAVLVGRVSRLLARQWSAATTSATSTAAATAAAAATTTTTALDKNQTETREASASFLPILPGTRKKTGTALSCNVTGATATACAAPPAATHAKTLSQTHLSGATATGVSFPVAPLHEVCAYLRNEVEQLVGPMRRDRSSRDDFARHILLLDEYLYQGNGAQGFTPSVVLSGIAEMLALYQQAFVAGKYFLRDGQQAPAASHASAAGQPIAERNKGTRDSAEAPAPSWAGIPVESFLPPLVRRTGPEVTREDEQREVTRSTVVDDNTAAAWERLYADSMNCSQAAAAAGRSINKANTTAAQVAAAAAAAVAEVEKEAALEAAKRQQANPHTAQEAAAASKQRIFTVPDAIHALLTHLSTHPLICITAEDQRCLPEAVSALCNVMASIVATMGHPGGAQFEDATLAKLRLTTGMKTSSFRALTHTLRYAALEAMQSLLAPLLPTESASTDNGSRSNTAAAAAPSVSLVNGRVSHPVLTSRKTGSRTKHHNPLYTTAATAFAQGLVVSDENDGDTTTLGDGNARAEPYEAGVLPSRVFPSLFRRWQLLLHDMATVSSPDGEVEDEKDACLTPLTAALMAGSDSDPTIQEARMPEELAPGSTLHHRQCTGELTALLRVVTQLFGIATHHGWDILTNPHVTACVPRLVLRTLAQCSSAKLASTESNNSNGLGGCDVASTLCMDLLWKLVENNAGATAKAVLYAGHKNDDVSLTECLVLPEAAVTTPAEDLFQALLNQLSAVHRQQHREMRNDLVAFLSALLRADAVRCTTGAAAPCGGPMKAATVDALNATALVLFDLVCGPEVGSGGGLANGHRSSPSPLANAKSGGSSGRRTKQLSFLEGARAGEEGAVAERGHNHEGHQEDAWLALTVTLSSRMPPLTQQALKRHCGMSMRCRAVASPTLRKDSLQFKRLGWECLQLFYDWQVAHLAGTLFASTPDSDGEDSTDDATTASLDESESARPHGPDADYTNFVLVDLCRMGLVDVLLMYGDLSCDNPAVVAWTREELLTLQMDAWTLLTALVGTSALLAEVNAAYASLDTAAAAEAQQRLEEEDEEDEAREEGDEAPSRLLLSPADAQLVEAGGIDIVLAYLQAPSVPITLNQAVTTAAPAPNTTFSVTVTKERGELESHKKAALMLLAALASNGVSTNTATSAPSKAVRKALLHTPSLISFLLSVLDNVFLMASNGVASGEEDAQDPLVNDSFLPSVDGGDNNGGVTIPSQGKSRTLFLSDSDMDVVIAVLNLLVGVSEAAVEMGGGIREITDPSPSVSHQLSLQQPRRGRLDDASRAVNKRRDDDEEDDDEDEEKALNVSYPRWNRSSTHHAVFAVEEEFALAGGVPALLRWLACLLEPQTQAAQQLGDTFALTARSAMSSVSRKHGQAPRAPPLLEGLLVRHLPLVCSLLDALSALAMGSMGSEADLVEAGGVHVLLDVVEAMAILSEPGNIFAPFMTSTIAVRATATAASESAPSVNTALDATVVIRDPSCALLDAAARDEADMTDTMSQRSEQRTAFHDVLAFTLNILSDLLFASAVARAQFMQWRSRRIEKITSATNCSGGASANSPHSFMNGVQLLINLWLSSLPKECGQGAATTTLASGRQLEDAVTVAGLELLQLTVRDSIGESLRREYVRRLMREKYAESQQEHETRGIHCRLHDDSEEDEEKGSDGGEQVSHSSRSSDGSERIPSPFTEEELVRYAVYIAQGGSFNNTMARDDRESVAATILGSDHSEGGRVKRQAIDAMLALLDVTDEESEVARGNLTKDVLKRKIGLGVKVHGCLAALGFEAMVLASDSTRAAAASFSKRPSEENQRPHVNVLALDTEDPNDQESCEELPGHHEQPETYGPIALSPAERAQLTVIAALPALCVDEVCLAMATVALETGAEVKAGAMGSNHDKLDVDTRLPEEDTGEASEKALIRPTTPDRRCLLGLLSDIYARGSELAQLVNLCHEVEKAQATQLLDRFLATRIRFAPPTPAEAKKLLKRQQQQRTASSMGRLVRAEQDPYPSVVVSLSPTAASASRKHAKKTNENQGPTQMAATGDGILASSSSFSSPFTGAGAAHITPARLATSVRNRLEDRQQRDNERALHLTTAAAASFQATRHRQQSQLPHGSTDEPVDADSEDDAHSDYEPSQDFQEAAGTAASSALAEAAHTLSTRGARSRSPTTTISQSHLSGASAADAPKPKPFSNSYTSTGKPSLSLAQRREKRLHMIRNSLRKLPGAGDKVGSTAGEEPGRHRTPTLENSRSGTGGSPPPQPRENNYTTNVEGTEGSTKLPPSSETDIHTRVSSPDKTGAAPMNAGQTDSIAKTQTLAELYNTSFASSDLGVVEIDLGKV